MTTRKTKFLTPFAQGERIGCYALTEPQAGSNAAALRTVAVRDGDHYVVNGTKAWITCGGVAYAAVVYVNTEPAKGEKGITALIVERGTPGFRVGKEEKKLGIHATACTELSFTDCRVPVANRLGAEGEGYKIALGTLDGGRIGIAAQAVGIAQGAFEQALVYAQERQAFGHPISDFQAIQFMLADMATEIDAARLLVRKAAWKQDAGGRFSMEAAGPSSSLPRWPPASLTKPSRFTAAMVTAASILSSACTATPASPKSTKAPAKSSA